jgi:hypothetical protein
VSASCYVEVEIADFSEFVPHAVAAVEDNLLSFDEAAEVLAEQAIGNIIVTELESNGNDTSQTED